MKSKFCVGVLLVFLFWLMAISGVPLTKDAIAAEPVTLEVYDPTGSTAVTQLFAPRLGDLNGKTICELTNEMWESTRTFPVITDLLKKQFPTAKIIEHTMLPAFSERSTPADFQKMTAALKAAGCQAAIVGNAG